MQTFFNLPKLEEQTLVSNPATNQTHDFSTVFGYFKEREAPHQFAQSLDEAFKTFSYMKAHGHERDFNTDGVHSEKIANAFDTLLIASDIIRSMTPIQPKG